MTLSITDTTMTSDQTVHTARPAHGGQPGWEVSWLPGQIVDRNSAITAMTLAEIAGKNDLHEGHRLWPHIQGWAAELGLTGSYAVAQASRQPDWEAADLSARRSTREPCRRQQSKTQGTTGVPPS